MVNGSLCCLTYITNYVIKMRSKYKKGEKNQQKVIRIKVYTVIEVRKHCSTKYNTGKQSEMQLKSVLSVTMVGDGVVTLLVHFSC